MITDYQRLKEKESRSSALKWSVSREIAKLNYKIHTNAIKEILVPDLTNSYRNYVYATEADVLNVAMFGITAEQWRQENPDRVINKSSKMDVVHKKNNVLMMERVKKYFDRHIGMREHIYWWNIL